MGWNVGYRLSVQMPYFNVSDGNIQKWTVIGGDCIADMQEYGDYSRLSVTTSRQDFWDSVSGVDGM